MPPIAPGATIGILGGGQLGRMLALAAARLGYKTHIYAGNADEPACQVTPLVTLGSFADPAQLARFAAQVDVITLEWENVPLAALALLATLKPMHPGAAVLAITQDRIAEKTFINQCGIATPAFRPAASLAQAEAAVQQLSLPAILKTARMGYDGKGQAVIRTQAACATAWQSLHPPGTIPHAIVEAMVPFAKEISVIVARRADGVMACYDAVENRHKNGMLDETHAPAHVPPATAHHAQLLAKTLAQTLGVVGLLAVEMFVLPDNSLCINEMAPRPHNSGHWSMDAAATSQFEQHIRAICGLPLGAPTLHAPAVMKNLIGADIQNWQHWLEQPNASLHLYGKTTITPGRKMGHVTLVDRGQRTEDRGQRAEGRM